MEQAEEDRDVDLGWEDLEMDQEAEEEREEQRRMEERIAEPGRFIAAVVAEAEAGGYLYENGQIGKEEGHKEWVRRNFKVKNRL